MLIESAQTYTKVASLITIRQHRSQTTDQKKQKERKMKSIGHYKATQVSNNRPKETKGKKNEKQCKQLVNA